jgi:hypothetical protein
MEVVKMSKMTIIFPTEDLLNSFQAWLDENGEEALTFMEGTAVSGDKYLSAEHQTQVRNEYVVKITLHDDDY